MHKAEAEVRQARAERAALEQECERAVSQAQDLRSRLTRAQALGGDATHGGEAPLGSDLVQLRSRLAETELERGAAAKEVAALKSELLQV